MMIIFAIVNVVVVIVTLHILALPFHSFTVDYLSYPLRIRVHWSLMNNASIMYINCYSPSFPSSGLRQKTPLKKITQKTCPFYSPFFYIVIISDILAYVSVTSTLIYLDILCMYLYAYQLSL